MNRDTDPTLVSRPRRPWKVAVLIFGLGLAVGVALSTATGVVLMRGVMRRLPQDRPGMAERAANRVIENVRSELELSATDLEAVSEILRDSALRSRAIRVEAFDAIEAELQRSTGAVAAVLPPEKRAAWHELVRFRFERLGLEPPELAP